MFPIGLCAPCWHIEGAWACQQAQMHASNHKCVLVGMPNLPVYANRAQIGLLVTCVLLNSSLSVSQYNLLKMTSLNSP